MAKILIGDHSKPESKAPEGRISQGAEPPPTKGSDHDSREQPAPAAATKDAEKK
jgi:hypothetical protein